MENINIINNKENQSPNILNEFKIKDINNEEKNNSLQEPEKNEEISPSSQAYIFCKSLLSINERNDSGWTPIFKSIIANNSKALIELIKFGGNPNITNNLGETPLYFCVENDNFILFKILLENGADPNIQKKNGETVTHLMIKKKSEKKYFIEILKFNVNTNIPNKLYNQTATHLALKNKLDEDILIGFKRKKADIHNIKDKYDKSAFDYARDLNDKKYLDMISKIFDKENIENNIEKESENSRISKDDNNKNISISRKENEMTIENKGEDINIKLKSFENIDNINNNSNIKEKENNSFSPINKSNSNRVSKINKTSENIYMVNDEKEESRKSQANIIHIESTKKEKNRLESINYRLFKEIKILNQKKIKKKENSKEISTIYNENSFSYEDEEVDEILNDSISNKENINNINKNNLIYHNKNHIASKDYYQKEKKIIKEKISHNKQKICNNKNKYSYPEYKFTYQCYNNNKKNLIYNDYTNNIFNNNNINSLNNTTFSSLYNNSSNNYNKNKNYSFEKSSNNSLIRFRDWLISCDLLSYYNILIKSNIRNIDKYIQDIKNNKIKELTFKDIESFGIKKPGHIFRLLLKLEIDTEKIDYNLYNFIIDKFNINTMTNNGINTLSSNNDFYCLGLNCGSYNNKKYEKEKENDLNYYDIFSFLKKNNLLKFKENFIHNGFDQIDYIFIQLFSKYSFDRRILNDYLHIYLDQDKNYVLKILYQEKKKISNLLGMQFDDIQLKKMLLAQDDSFSYNDYYLNSLNENKDDYNQNNSRDECCNIF
jgi:ankyrin repeat protein